MKTAAVGAILGFIVVTLAYDVKSLPLTIVCAVMAVLLTGIVGFFENKEYE